MTGVTNSRSHTIIKHDLPGVSIDLLYNDAVEPQGMKTTSGNPHNNGNPPIINDFRGFLYKMVIVHFYVNDYRSVSTTSQEPPVSVSKTRILPVDPTMTSPIAATHHRFLRTPQNQHDAQGQVINKIQQNLEKQLGKQFGILKSVGRRKQSS